MDDHHVSYRRLFSHAEVVRDLLLGFVPGDWVREHDVNSLKQIGENFGVDESHSEDSSLIWQVNLTGSQMRTCLMLVFQSKADPFTSLRIFQLIGLLYQDLIRRREVENGQPLPFVLPVVLYGGQAEWQAPEDLADLIRPMPGELREAQLRQRFLLLDKGRHQKHPLSGGANLVSALFQLENSTTLQMLQPALSVWVERLKATRHTDLHGHFMEWLRGWGASLEPALHWHEMSDIEEVHSMLARRARK